MIHEPAVAATDYALALECGVLAILILRQPTNTSRMPFAMFFAATGTAALLGGTVHGFFSDETTFAYSLLWKATLLSIGVAAVAAAIAAGSGWGSIVRRIVLPAVTAGFAIYCVTVLFFRQDFRVAILVYFPATVFLLVTFLYLSARITSARFRLLVGALGLVLTFIAAGVQQSRIALGVLDHNAIYHIIQALALAAIYIGALAITQSREMS